MSVFSVASKIGKVALGLIPGGNLIPVAIDAIEILGGIIGGNTGEKITQGAQSISDGLQELSTTPFTPEQRVQLEELKSSKEIQLKQIAFEELKLEYDDVAGGRDVIKTDILSDDPVVRQARPRMMVKLGNSCILFSFVTPCLLLLSSWLQISTSDMSIIKETIVWIGGFLFSSFSVSFTGYTYARTIDKRTAAGEHVSTIENYMSKIANKIR